jgi:hypothetical protein
MASLGGTLLFACEFVTHGPDFEAAPADVSGDCPGATKCGGSCVNLDSDPAHCGACGAGCPGGFCVKSVCMNQCPPPSSICGAKCVDLQTDPTNCGTCGHPCAGTRLCNRGVCTDNCPTGTNPCGIGAARRCVDLTSDPANCGACAGTIGAPAGTGTCPAEKPLCVTSRCARDCPAPLTVCGNACVDTSTNPLHCGGCGACVTAPGIVATSGVELCSNSKCVLACNNELTNCNNTQCVNLATDALNCGFCNNKCLDTLSASNRCVASRCCAAGSTGCP